MVNLMNCQTKRTTITKRRKIAHKGIEIERNSIATATKYHFISFKHLCHLTEIIR